MNTVAEYIKQYSSDLKFVDDLAVKNTPTAKTLWTAFKNDRKLVKLTRQYDRRLRKKYPDIKMHRFSAEFRGTKLYARFCAWDDLYPDAGLHDSVWPAVKNRLDEIVGNN